MRRSGSGLGSYEAWGCWPYERDDPPRPVVDVVVEDPLTGEWVRVKARVDTGFSGHLLLPWEEFEKVSSLEIPAEERNVYSSVCGPVRMRGAKAYVEALGVRKLCLVETPLVGWAVPLLGRKLLAEARVALLGPEGRLCLLRSRI